MPPIEVLAKRTRSSKTHSLGGRKFAWDGTIGSVHYQDNGWQDIDNEFLPVAPPWNWEMVRADYHVRVKEDFTAGQILQFEVQGETVEIQPMALELTNDLDQIQQVSMPQNVTPLITNPIVDLLPDVPSHQGTIRWNNAYGSGIDFEWKCQSTRLAKTLSINSLGDLPVPQQYIIDGGNPVLRLNLIFDPPSNVDIVVDGQVWNQQSDTQTFNLIEFVKDGEVLWGFMPLKYWDSGDALETSEGQSVATLEKRGNKFYISIRVPYSWLQTAVYPVFIDTDIVPQPAQIEISSDDCMGRPGSPPFWSTDTINVYAGDYSAIAFDYETGSRFQTITVPQGAIIDTAYLSIYAKVLYPPIPETFIDGEDAGDTVTFSTAGDFEGRPRTSAIIPWTPGTWTEHNWYNSDEIKTVIKEIVDRGDWSPENSMVLFWKDAPNYGETSCLVGHSFDDNTSLAPKLHIEYSEVAGETYVETREQVVLGVVGQSENFLFPETRDQVVLGAIGQSDLATFNELEKAQTVVAVAGKSDLATFGEPEKEQVVLAVIEEAEQLIKVETREQTVLGVVAEADLATFTDAREQVISAVVEESDLATWNELNRLLTVLAVQGSVVGTRLYDLNREQVILAVIEKAEQLIKVESLAQTILAVVEEVEQLTKVEAREQVILAAQAESDLATFLDAKSQTVLATAEETDLVTFLDAKSQTVLGVIGETDLVTFLETLKEQVVLGVVGEADLYIFVETLRDQIILAVTSGDAVFPGVLYEEIRTQVIRAIVEESENLTFTESLEQIILAVQLVILIKIVQHMDIPSRAYDLGAIPTTHELGKMQKEYNLGKSQEDYNLGKVK